MNEEKLRRLMPLLRCPRSGTPLRLLGGSLVSESGDKHPIIDGKPVLVKRIADLHVTTPSKNLVSQNIRSYELAAGVAALPGWKLHLGSGNVPCLDKNVISIDVLPNENVDLVAEAEALPFADDSFVWVESGAVFEHLYDPLSAIAQVKRVLAPGGRFYIDTAFMQGYHGFPCHYFNMTPQAVETFILDDFELETSQIPMSGSPAHALDNLLRRFIEGLPLKDRVRISSSTVSALLAELTRPDRQKEMYEAMSEHVRRCLAASVCVVGRKPFKYLPNQSSREVRRDYYAARVGVIERYFEVEHYRGRVRDSDADFPGPTPSGTLDELLNSARVMDTMNAVSWEVATSSLKDIDSALTTVRDGWLGQYLAIQERKKGTLWRGRLIDLVQRLWGRKNKIDTASEH